MGVKGTSAHKEIKDKDGIQTKIKNISNTIPVPPKNHLELVNNDISEEGSSFDSSFKLKQETTLKSKEKKEDNKISIPHNLDAFGLLKSSSIIKNINQRKAPLEIINEIFPNEGKKEKKEKKFSLSLRNFYKNDIFSIKNSNESPIFENIKESKKHVKTKASLKSMSPSMLVSNNIKSKKKKDIIDLDNFQSKGKINNENSDILFEGELYFIPSTYTFKGSQLSTRFLSISHNYLKIYQTKESFFLINKPLHIINKDNYIRCEKYFIKGISNKKILNVSQNIFLLEFSNNKNKIKKDQINGKFINIIYRLGY